MTWREYMVRYCVTFESTVRVQYCLKPVPVMKPKEKLVLFEAHFDVSGVCQLLFHKVAMVSNLSHVE